jgi:hypothetical protein
MLPMEQAALYRLEESSLLLRVPFNFPPFFCDSSFRVSFRPSFLVVHPSTSLQHTKRRHPVASQKRAQVA